MNTLPVTAARKTAGPRRLWRRTTEALGKIWAGVVSLPDRLPRAAERDFRDYPRFPMF